MNKQIRRLITFLTLSILIACARVSPSAQFPKNAETSVAARSVSTATPFSCQVTPYSAQKPPDPHTASFTETWYGNDALWAGLAPPYEGNWYAGPKGLKVLWYRSVAGQLTVEGRRLDAEAPGLQADIPAGYGNVGYQASGLIFPSEGCWEVIGRVAGQDLRFVVQVHPASEDPTK